MRRGVPERGLWFAGEHTSPFVALGKIYRASGSSEIPTNALFLGTVTGAYWSGEGVAKRIARAYDLSVGEVKE